MAALLVFVVFLVAIAVSIPIGTSMILGSISPILLMHRGDLSSSSSIIRFPVRTLRRFLLYRSLS